MMSMLKRYAAYVAALVVLLLVFSLYFSPDLYVTVSNLFWSCFG